MKDVFAAIAKRISLSNVRAFLDHHSFPLSAVPVSIEHSWKFTLCMPSGSTSSNPPAEGKATRGKRIK